jgi:hypothetical protein
MNTAKLHLTEFKGTNSLCVLTKMTQTHTTLQEILEAIIQDLNGKMDRFC